MIRKAYIHTFFIIHLAIGFSFCPNGKAVSKIAPQDYRGERQQTYSDKRNYPRIHVQERLWCECDGRTLLVQTANISRGGLFVQSPYQPHEGNLCLLSYLDAYDDIINIDAEVIWCRNRSNRNRSGIGMRFIHKDSGQRLFELLRNLNRKKGSIPPAITEWASKNIYAKNSSTPES